MYFELQEYYHRDVLFVYSESNAIDYVDALNGALPDQTALSYEVDELDDKVSGYDLLPTLGLPLISQRFLVQCQDLIGREIAVFPVTIQDKKGRRNSLFSAMFVLNSYECVDQERSTIRKKTYRTGTQTLRITQLYLNTAGIGKASIFRVTESPNKTLVTEGFKNRCTGLKGFYFIEVHQ
ncbi:conserved hypothetical protein [Vibrio nigripulchritudo SFn27]|uniref:imm11 family protein n=1 Tax=Vibrio nigripulchritudo TaxID=28173 RepID=UPI0003B187BB|nr:hypothetical protein [Vibrio nigripulchritudo]CCN38633.1 conserved hypothetical protein [Vibrio nigripulchritudo AM115]CCN44942.1 conserved hypothetical protein [Vibrio nigripulchritudo FTn2]CCN79697.1 conserved hypothetical protein [Vibrio nigripulchritudo SO65]CCN85902.1 conserved hypothetical protein [Vibrio nigripulchritudo BLFn1]CCN91893.1 conserved hypothetical protein [Vibrio nigripulchritudo SFn27]